MNTGEEKLLRAEEVALLVGISTQTLNNWYHWRRLHPAHRLAEFLPECYQSGPRQTRYWKKSDVWMIAQFKNAIPHGRNGILGEVTQRRKKKGD